MAKADLDPNFREFLKLLNSARVRYLVVGGYAVIYHGYHRATSDLDVWIATDEENAPKVSAVLQEFAGYPPSQVRPSMFRKPGHIFQFGRVPLRIDILTGPDGVEFESCYARRQVVLLDGVRVPLISKEDLIANKRASGRPKDVADLDKLTQKLSPLKRAKRKRK